ncbi:ribosome maturation factor RimM [Profundibacterium mesophilum]|uniref:Ribosome maturation factor RimM n=1 Tax=Profundibacterium mesophilum KAUST100406-0324 TaxID=1037889 RepID=A0A921TE44_9RHOB|nr:ribosome maturation factor RimM [Profundibacterium mesophilum]KAF0676917.1 Ribosome maturation factor RimM [Profundibacterium mesophilum KAUST100406-0324]
MSEELICVGSLAGAFGVNGEVRLKSFCAEPSDIANYGPFTSEDGSARIDLRLVRPIKSGFAVRITGIDTREQADGLAGTRLFAPRGRLPELPDDEFYHADLIGLAVVDTGGAAVGTVHAVQNHGAGDLLEIRRPEGADTVLLPFTRAVVPTVDIGSGRIVVDPPEGALG